MDISMVTLSTQKDDNKKTVEEAESKEGSTHIYIHIYTILISNEITSLL
jgi:hypothetical protein